MSADEKMIRGCLDGKRRAQSQLYQRFAQTMFGVCLRYSRNREEAEDLLQEGFIKVFQHIANYKGTGSFEGWIRRIMVNTAINHFHATVKQQWVHVEDIEKVGISQEEEQYSPQGEEAYAVSPETVMQLIQKMPDGYRMVLNLYVFEGYQHKEIANMLGVSENTSKSQLSKGRKYLKQLINKLLDKEYKILEQL
ncbi:MAG TPA: RNA polymerase sigma factor [Bacteroidales bacterium]|nr:RNA polymerase sigma factor [Bacteroidales bacterium]HSA44490.1 RNA polymerase sigma factor [Bacteroidales bacterium]